MILFMLIEYRDCIDSMEIDRNPVAARVIHPIQGDTQTVFVRRRRSVRRTVILLLFYADCYW